VNADLKARVLAAAATTPSPPRAAVHRRNALNGMVAGVSGIGVFLIYSLLMSGGQWLRLGGDVVPHQHLERSVWLAVTTAGGAAGMAAVAVWLALSRGQSMLGRSRGWLYGSVLIPPALLAWKVSCSVAFGYALVDWPERVGLKCLSLSLLVAAGPLLAFLATRRSAPVQPALNGAALGVAAGACAWVAVDLWCPVASVPHLFFGHVMPLYILAGVGALLGQAILSIRRRNDRAFGSASPF
jgi:hypothetical protein